MQTLKILLRPPVGLLALLISLAFAMTLSYFDEFLFFAPYTTFYVAPDRILTFTLDMAVSALSGIVLSLSVHQLGTPPKMRSPGKLGVAGIISSFVAGACPCYYLVPLLAAAGGVGGVLGAVGIFFYAYQLPVKFASILLLCFVIFALERSFRASCAVVTAV